MLSKKILILMTLTILAALLVSSTAYAGSPKITSQEITWELTRAKVVEAGQTGLTEEGILTTGYTLEAMAKAKGGSLLPAGTLQLTLTAFSPTKEMPGQEIGKWYVQGKWSITQMGADPKGAKARHNPYVAKGTIAAVLDFNPAAAPGNWVAQAVLPMSPAAGTWARGDGSLNMDEKNNGYLYLDLKLWPQVR